MGYSYSAECNQHVGLLYIAILCKPKAYTRDLRMPILKLTVGLNCIILKNFIYDYLPRILLI